MTDVSSGRGAASAAPRPRRIVVIIKYCPGNRALDEVSLDGGSSESVAVVGHNGSGKSTLVKSLDGVYTSDGGTVELAEVDGQQTNLYVIHQDLGLAKELTGLENLGITTDKGAAALAPFRSKKERAHARPPTGRFGQPFAHDVPTRRPPPPPHPPPGRIGTKEGGGE